MSGEVAGHFVKKSVFGCAFYRLNSPSDLPDVPEKVREGHRTFVKKPGKVGELFQKSLIRLSNFSKKIR
jgi:hypothetical protein